MLALGRRLNLPVEELDVEELSEDVFWDIIDMIDPAKPETVSESATIALAKKTESEIKSFADILSEKLFALDKRAYVEKLTGGYDESYFSPDHFLDIRAFLVASGRAFYEAILLGTAKVTDLGICEELLSLPANAWKLKTGATLDYLPTKNYFTYSNPNGWDETLID